MTEKYQWFLRLRLLGSPPASSPGSGLDPFLDPCVQVAGGEGRRRRGVVGAAMSDRSPAESAFAGDRAADRAADRKVRQSFVGIERSSCHGTYNNAETMSETDPSPSGLHWVKFPMSGMPCGRFNRLGLNTTGDLMRHLPIRYEREVAELMLEDARTEALEDPKATLAVRGVIAVIRRTPGRKPRIEATLEDASGTANLVWFNANWILGRLHPGDEVLVQGRAGIYRDNLQFANPKFTPIDDLETAPPVSTDDRLKPVYPGSEELLSSRIERVLSTVLEPCLRGIEDPLPEDYRAGRELMPLAEAYRAVHAPRDEEEAARARRRLAFDELLLLQLGVMMRRHHLREELRAPALRWDDELDARIRARFPFPSPRPRRGSCARWPWT